MLNRDCSKTKQSSSNNTIVLAVLILCINFVGIYSAEFEPSADTEQRCTNVTCPVVGTDTCDLDSTPVASESGLDECCTGREVCKCDYQKCHKNVPMECDEGYGRLLVTPGEGKPGKCCDQYQCKQLPDRCGGIQCPNFFAETLEPYGEDGKCPEDSYRPISYIPEGACCPIFPQCTCRAEICLPARCLVGERLVIDRKGNGQPGSCCDLFHCVQHSRDRNNDNNSSNPPSPRSVPAVLGCTHDGLVYDEGEHWHAACQSCACSGGVALCSFLECPIIAPGCKWVGNASEFDCCPTCLGCRDDNGVKYSVGEHYQKDDCTSCQCSEEFQWQKYICTTECENPQRVPGQCCPVCINQTLSIEPPIMCPVVMCSLFCEHGLAKNDWGCFECKCVEIPPNKPLQQQSRAFINDSEVIMDPNELSKWSNENCIELTPDLCSKTCDNGFVRDEKGCAICKCQCPSIGECLKHCLYGFENDNSSGCPICKCKLGQLLTNSSASSNIQEHPGSKGLETGTCFSTTEMTQQIRRDDGEWWTDENNCRQCFCQQSRVYCSLIACPSRPLTCPDDKWSRVKGQCCAVCQMENENSEDGGQLLQALTASSTSVCHSPGTGRLLVDGETWQLSACVSCTCTKGYVFCSAQECPPITCENPVNGANGNCCSSCPEEVSENKNNNVSPSQKCLDFGSAWRIDECTSCKCLNNGITKCYSEACDTASSKCPAGKWLMVKGRCCPLCSDELSETFRDDRGCKLDCEGDERAGNNGCCKDGKLPRLYSFSGSETKTILITSTTTENEVGFLENPQFLTAVALAILCLCLFLCLIQTVLIQRVCSRKSAKTILPCTDDEARKQLFTSVET